MPTILHLEIDWQWVWDYGLLLLGLNAEINRPTLKPPELIVQLGVAIGALRLEIVYV